MLPIFAPTNSLNRMTFLSDPPTENAPDTSVTTVPAPPDHTETEPTSLFHRSHSPSTSTFPGRSTHRHVRRPSMSAPPKNSRRTNRQPLANHNSSRTAPPSPCSAKRQSRDTAIELEEQMHYMAAAVTALSMQPETQQTSTHNTNEHLQRITHPQNPPFYGIPSAPVAQQKCTNKVREHHHHNNNAVQHCNPAVTQPPQRPLCPLCLANYRHTHTARTARPRAKPHHTV